MYNAPQEGETAKSLNLVVYDTPEERETAKSLSLVCVQHTRRGWRYQKSLNLVVYNTPEEGETANSLSMVVNSGCVQGPKEGETAKTRRQALKPLTTEFSAAVETTLNKYDDKDVRNLVDIPVAAERLGKFVADCTKPRTIQLVYEVLTTWRWDQCGGTTSCHTSPNIPTQL